MLASLLSIVLLAAAAATEPCLNVSLAKQGNFNTTNNRTCYQNVVWAMRTGIIAHPDWYAPYNVTVNSSLWDFQKALYFMGGTANEGVGWNCNLPCGAEEESLAKGNMTESTPEDGSKASSSSSASSSMPWWGWLLLGLGLLAPCFAALVHFLLGGKKAAAKKSKRAPQRAPAPEAAPLVVAEPATSTESLPAPAQSVFFLQPQLVPQPQRSYFMPSPVPVTTSIPVMTPISTAAPVSYVAVPSPVGPLGAHAAVPLP